MSLLFPDVQQRVHHGLLGATWSSTLCCLAQLFSSVHLAASSIRADLRICVSHFLVSPPFELCLDPNLHVMLTHINAGNPGVSCRTMQLVCSLCTRWLPARRLSRQSRHRHSPDLVVVIERRQLHCGSPFNSIFRSHSLAGIHSNAPVVETDSFASVYVVSSDGQCVTEIVALPKDAASSLTHE